MGKKRVVAAGNICLDITLPFSDYGIRDIGQLLSPGRLTEIKAADVHTGGSVANTGLAMKLLGADVTLMGKVGDDAFGKMVIGILESYHPNRNMIVAAGESTSYSVILAAPGIDRIFLHCPGANATFTAADIPEESLRDAALFHFGYPPLMKALYEKEGEPLLELLQKVKQAGAAISLDMASVDANSEAGKVPWEKVLNKILPLVDFFVPSAEELCYMLDRPRLEEWKRRAGEMDVTEEIRPEDIRPLADRCMDMGAKILLIKCGVSGLYYRSADRSVLETISGRLDLDLAAWSGQEGFQESFVPDRVLSGTGAGDVSIAAFLTAMLDGYGIEEAARFAAAAGADCVTAYDALGGLKSFEVWNEKIEAGWKKRSGKKNT